METALTSQPVSEGQPNPPPLELAGGGPININAGRIVLANGETAPISTDPSSKFFFIFLNFYCIFLRNCKIISDQNTIISLKNTLIMF